ncbi:MAG: helix-turn-helix domain-containing protein [Thermodesulfobacteriota bacterium]
MMEEHTFQSDALQGLYDKYIKGDPESVALMKQYEVAADIAKQICDLRTQSGLSVEQLAQLVGVGERVIEALEEADYEGDSLGMLVRIASALGKRLEVRFVPATSTGTPGP